MQMEPIALNMSDPVAMAAWYKEHLEFEIVRSMAKPPYTRFLKESGGRMMLEIYRNPPDQVPSCSQMNPLLLHLAFVSADPETDKSALLAAGATSFIEEYFVDGSYLVMMHDPWRLAIQFCRRETPFLHSTD